MAQKFDSPLIKRIFLTFLIGTIVSISISKFLLMIKATYLYYLTGTQWFEWLNYLILSFAVLILPICTLLFLDSTHMRRLLRVYLFGIVGTNALAFYEDVATHLDTLFLYDRPLNPILIFIESIAALFCWIFLLRQVNGKSLLPIPIKTKMRHTESRLRDFLQGPFIDLVEFVKKPKKHNKKRVNSVCLIHIVIFSGLIVTMIPEGTTITLERPDDHDMRIWFWTSDPADYNNETLDIMAANNIGIKIWQDYKDPEFDRFADRDIDVVIAKGFTNNPENYNAAFNGFKQIMDYWDSMPDCPFVGFVDDMEQMAGVSRYNRTWYESYVEFIRNTTNYIRSRGYEAYITQWLMSTNDYRDGDPDMGVVYENPFEPRAFENVSTVGWMTYRSEQGIIYDEPSPYFTYQWASQTRDYMEFLDDSYDYENEFWANKSELSIGCVGVHSFWTYNSEINPTAKQQLFTDLAICHACEIAEVTIWIAQEMDTKLFKLIGGADGLLEMLEYVDSYDSINIEYKRRATFFGNLKLLSNITGSVFGILYSDVLYDSWAGYLVFLWCGVWLISAFYIVKAKKDNREYKKEADQDAKDENAYELEDKSIAAVRIASISAVITVFTLTGIFFFQPELFVTLQNLDIILK